MKNKAKKELKLSEDQLSNEFYRSVCSILNPDYFQIHCQAGKEISEDFIGELDLSVGSGLNYYIEFTRESSKVVEHVMRKFKAENDKLENEKKLKKQGKYVIPKDGGYLVIDFIEEKQPKSYKKIEELSTIFGDEDYKDRIKDHLMRVVYDAEI